MSIFTFWQVGFRRVEKAEHQGCSGRIPSESGRNMNPALDSGTPKTGTKAGMCNLALVLAVHSDTSCLSEPKARSRAGGHFFLTSDTTLPPNNGAVLNIAHIIKNVISSDTEAELMGLYIMARKAVYIRIILEELGHKQPPTPQQTDNTIAEAIINGKIQPKKTKAMDIRFHWLRDCECQQQFRVYWRPGKMNYADYWTKHNQNHIIGI